MGRDRAGARHVHVGQPRLPDPRRRGGRRRRRADAQQPRQGRRRPAELVLAFDDSTPETTIDSGRTPRPTRARRRSTFASDRADATFECSLDGAAFAALQLAAPRGRARRGRPHASTCGRRGRSGPSIPRRRDMRGRIAIPPETTIDGPASPAPAPTRRWRSRPTTRTRRSSARWTARRSTACASPLELLGPARRRARGARARDRPVRQRRPDAGRARLDGRGAAEVDDRSRAPRDPSNEPAPSFEFAAPTTGPGRSLRVPARRRRLGPCASPHGVGPLADGAHTFRVRATDAAGNAERAASARLDDRHGRAGGDDRLRAARPEQRRVAELRVRDRRPARAFECRVDGARLRAVRQPQRSGRSTTACTRSRCAPPTPPATPAYRRSYAGRSTRRRRP